MRQDRPATSQVLSEIEEVSLSVFAIRQATGDDIDWLLGHRIEMFRSMGRSDEELRSLQPIVEDFLRTSWDESLVAFLAIEDNRVIGGCAVTVYKVMPSVGNPSGNVLYAHNMFVEPDARGKGVGSALLQRIIEFAAAVNARRVELYATELGEGIYEKAGFVRTENHYALRLE